MDDSELLRQYTESGSAGAFAQLMSRHIGMVYGAARRQVADPHLADDVTQAVFLLLSRKAKKVHDGAGLPGWLLITTHYVARHARKLENRRRIHEKRAAAMAETRAPKSKDTAWQEVYPELDAALARLNAKDRSIVALHFIEGRTFREVGSTLGISEDAARLASARAVLKLRQKLSSRGGDVSASALVGLLAAHGLATPPAGLSSAISATAILGTAKSSSLVLLLAEKAALTMKLKSAALTSGLVALVLAAGMASIGAFNHFSATSRTNSSLARGGDGTNVSNIGAGLIATYSTGGSIELIGIAKYPAEFSSWWAGPQWWESNGEPVKITLANPELPAPMDPNGEHRQLYQFAFRTHDLQLNPRDLCLFALGEPDGMQGVYLQPAGTDKSGILYASALLYPEQAATNLCVRLASEPYQHATLDSEGRTIVGDEAAARGFLPLRVGEKNGFTYLVLHGDPFVGTDFHITAVAADGARFFVPDHSPRFIGQEGDNSAMSVVCFAQPKQSIAQYEVELRYSRDWVSFRHVSLRPGTASEAFAENRMQYWEPSMVAYDREVRAELSQMLSSVRGGDAATASKLCQSLSDEIQARTASVRGTVSEYEVIEGQPVFAELQQALSQGDTAAALELLDSGNGNGHRICHMVNTLGGVPRAEPASQ